MAENNANKRILWLDLGDLGELFAPTGQGTWQDHGLGLLRTILHQNGVMTDIASTRAVRTWEQLRPQLAGYDVLLMNVRSYTFPVARRAAKLFKEVNPNGMVLTGGMHATVAADEMQEVAEFDRICVGAGEKVIVDLVKNPEKYPRVIMGQAAKSMNEWPAIDRTLWPQPPNRLVSVKNHFVRALRQPRHYMKQRAWPLEAECGWAPGPVATILTSRVCPWQCVFCNEASYIPTMQRRSVDNVIAELNDNDRKYGVGSVVIHDSMFFQNPPWLEEWREKYPRDANKTWSYWAAARADTVREWPDLFEALVKETNWNTISIGFEVGSDRMLKLLNKGCTAEDNYFAIDLLNRIGDEMVAKGKTPPKFFSNIMLGIPGEQPEDAFETMRMLKSMKYVIPSISFYAPYPGSALGYQLIAEGKSLMSKDNYHRFPKDEKVKGVDYKFYNQLLAGKFDDEINKGLPAYARKHSTAIYDKMVIKA